MTLTRWYSCYQPLLRLAIDYSRYPMEEGGKNTHSSLPERRHRGYQYISVDCQQKWPVPCWSWKQGQQIES